MPKRLKISEVEAARLKARVAELEALVESQRATWSSDWPGGVHVYTTTCEAENMATATIKTARRLGHAVVVVDSGRELRFYALPHPAVKP